MAKKLRRAVKAWAQQTDDEHPSWYATGWVPNCPQSQVTVAMLVPMALYERLTRKAAKRGRRGK